MKRLLTRWLLFFCLFLPVADNGHAGGKFACSPTPWEEIGPFYRPGAPVRDTIGQGYLLHGTVRSARDCSPIANARIEVWQVGPQGEYDDAHRATLYADRNGRYRLTTSFPPPYGRGRSHIHIVVDAKGFDGVITQHFPRKGRSSARFDLVLVPESAGSGRGRDPLGRPR
jgi:protocatechuate 3,4-dioxygenase beta subunit